MMIVCYAEQYVLATGKEIVFVGVGKMILSHKHCASLVTVFDRGYDLPNVRILPLFSCVHCSAILKT